MYQDRPQKLIMLYTLTETKTQNKTLEETIRHVRVERLSK
jgi:hypothetical protein